MLLRAGSVGTIGGWRRAPAPSAGTTYDPDASAFFARNTVQPSDEQKDVYDDFITQAKSIGVWDYIIDCGFCGAHDRQAAKLGIKNAVNLTQIGTDALFYPGYGFRGNGTSQAFDTGYMFPSGNQNNASIGFFSLSPGQSAVSAMANPTVAIMPRSSTTPDTAFYRVNNSGTSGEVNGQSEGVGLYFANRLTSTTEKLWKNGAIIDTTTVTSSAVVPTYSIYVGGRNAAAPTYATTYANFWHIGAGIPEALLPAYDALVRDTSARLSASHRTFATVTDETKTLYADFYKMTRQRSWWLGAFDNTYWPLNGGAPVLYDDIFTITGRYPKVAGFEWADPFRPEGPSNTAAQIARIKAHHARGGVTWLHQHPTNPVTNTNSIYGQVGDSSTPGSQYDMTGSPVLNVLAGGSRRTQFLDWIDRLSVFLNDCVDDEGVKIPIVLRFFHEINGGFFWWTDTGNPARTVQMYKDFIDRLRANGVTNALIDYNMDLKQTISSNYYPGDAYCDIISGDYYDNGSSTFGISEAEPAFSNLSTVLSYRRPKHFAEIGYQLVSNTDMTLWTTKNGTRHRTDIPNSAGFLIWRYPFGPTVGGANNSNFVAMVADPNCITVAP